jgi:hypothetical protein
LSSAEGHAGLPTEPATLSLTITVSANASFSVTAAVNTPNLTTTDLDNPVAEGGAAHPTVQANGETMQPMTVTASRSPLSRTSDLAIVESGTPVAPVADRQTEMSAGDLSRAEEAIGNMKTWNTAVGLIEQVMNAVDQIVGVC